MKTPKLIVELYDAQDKPFPVEVYILNLHQWYTKKTVLVFMEEAGGLDDGWTVALRVLPKHKEKLENTSPENQKGLVEERIVENYSERVKLLAMNQEFEIIKWDRTELEVLVNQFVTDSKSHREIDVRFVHNKRELNKKCIDTMLELYALDYIEYDDSRTLTEEVADRIELLDKFWC